VQLAYVDQGYTGEEPAHQAQEHGIKLKVQALGGQEGFCAACKALGGGTQFWLGGTLQASLKRLRASGCNSHPHALAGLRDSHALFSIRQKLISGSNPCDRWVILSKNPN